MTALNRSARSLPSLNLSVRSKFAGLFGLVTGLISLFIYVSHPARLQRVADGELSRRGQLIARLTAGGEQDDAAPPGAGRWERALAHAFEDVDVQAVEVLDTAGRRVAWRHRRADASPDDSPAAGEQILNVATPTVSGGQVRVVMSRARVIAATRRARRRAAMASAAVLLSGIIGTWAMGVAITDPLAKMVAVVSQVTEGDLTPRVVVSSRDELGKLARAINVMVSALQEAHAELADANRDLEVRVEESTSTLRRQISARKRAQLEVQRLQRFYELVLDSLPAQVAVFDRDLRYLYVNPALAANPDERSWIAGKSAADTWHRWGAASTAGRRRLDALRECLDTERPVRVEGPVHLSGRGERQFIRLFSPVRAVDGEVAQVIEYGLDVTERRAAERALREREEQLRQSQKMEAIGRLAGGVAHDFNNLLTVISGYTELALSAVQPGMPGGEELEQVMHAAQSAGTLTRQLLAFSRKQVLQPKVLDLNAVVSDLQKMLGRLIGEDIELVLDLYPNIGQVRSDPGQVEQVVVNLAVNARDAMPGGGTLTIETANVDLDAAAAAAQGIEAGPYVSLSITDTGTGMDDETRLRIFEPFFSTKDPDRGTGLGLSTVYGIVKQSGGGISVESEMGKKTSFHIYLPRIASSQPTRKPRPRARVGGGSETVLVVEDEDPVRDLARRALERAGYTVLDARDADHAMQVATAFGGPIHILVTDVVMPGPSGKELADRLASLRPETKVIFISGYTDDQLAHHGVFEANAAFLPKPFTTEGLSARVREVLDDDKKPKDAEVGMRIGE